MAEDQAAETAAPVLERAADDGKSRHFPCKSCGGDLVFPPGASALTCPYCGTVEQIPLTAEAIREFSFSDYLPPKKPTITAGSGAFTDMECTGCGSRIEVPRETAVRPCPYCGGTLMAKEAGEELIRPEAVLPFIIKREAAEKAVQAWLKSLWFAPNDLKRSVTFERFSSLYLPWWTFDSHTISHYSGDAGYRYTVTVGTGKNRRTETRIRWVSRSGVHERFFDDLPVPGGTFREWTDGYRLKELKPFDPSYLAGHSASHYTKDPKQAWPDAKSRMAQQLDADCRRLIGGDTQRNVQVATAHRGITYKLVLMPRWQGGYRYRERAFQIAVNGQTGVVSGDRPWSKAKITLAILAAVALIAVIALVANR